MNLNLHLVPSTEEQKLDPYIISFLRSLGSVMVILIGLKNTLMMNKAHSGVCLLALFQSALTEVAINTCPKCGQHHSIVWNLRLNNKR